MTQEEFKNRELSLDVIIPQYKETDDIIRPLLDSIEMQASISFKNIRTIIVNDHSDVKLSKEFLDHYKKINISYIETPENKGPGQARQYGIDNSEADYIMFADADDRLFSCNLFKEIYTTLRNNQDKKIDLIYTKWVEELVTADDILHVPHNTPDMTWLHGKIFRRQFLLDKNLRFNDRIKVHEDSYFNTITQMNVGTTASLDMYSYFWVYNTDSLTRNKSYKYNYLVETADDLVTSIGDTMEALTQRKTPKREEYFVKGILFMYFLLQAPYWNDTLATDQELQLRRRRYEYGILKLLTKYADIINNLDRKVFLKAYNDERAQCLVNTGFETEQETWNQFLARIQKAYPSYVHNCYDCKHGVFDAGGKLTCPFSVGNQCTMSLDQVYGIYSTPTKWEEKVETSDTSDKPTKKKTTKKKE